MAKPASKAAAGKPQTFADVLAAHTPEVRRIAERLRELVRGALPDAHEGIYGGAKVAMALYTLEHENDVVCAIQPAAGRCMLYIHRVGAEDAPDLRLYGKGKANRHIKFHGVEEINPEPILTLLKLSVARRG